MPSLNSPIITGDVSGGLHSTSVDKLKGNAVAATAPTNGQTLVWDSISQAWTPATPSTGGGGGANGLTYYLRQDVAADEPTTNLPGTPKQLGRTGATAQTSITSGTLTNGVWTLLGGYVSESVPLDPNTGSIPGGLWDLNLWALGTANANSPTRIRAKVYTYNGTDAPTLLATSGEQTINTVSAQYSVSVLVPQTTVELTTRIYVAVEVQASANHHTATLQFGDGTPSHVHTSLPLVGGTGLWKNVAGVLQSPASLLVNADVDAAAAIAQSKIDGLTDALGAKAAQAQVDVYSTAGTFTWTKPAGAKSVHVALLSGGGGGGSGRKTPSGTAGAGGGGGAGGGYSERVVQAAILGATETVTVGAGGPGGVAQTNAGTNGSIGGAGGSSSFGTFVTAIGARAGNGGTVTSGAGGTVTSAELRSMFLGAAGGTGLLVVGQAGTGNSTGAAGGGGGGGIAATTPSPTAGGKGGAAYYFLTGGEALGGVAPGGAGGTSVNVATNQAAGGGGGGGGASSLTGNGGAGGAGGFYGAGGGGGGAALDTFGNSGAGGAGAPGIVVVTTYF